MSKTGKTYVLGMFPYPSGEGLHVGHVRIFTACDVMARYFRMKGQDVLSPMGWDAFGLPAENAAIKAKKIPQEMVPHNYANFKKQMQNLSLSFDWEREFATTDPAYYAITQWIFLQLYNKKDQNGKRIVYREKVAINWCPKCLTGLANEEVLADGTHERCGTVVGKKLLPQWVMRITSYAERLLSDLDMDLSPWFDRDKSTPVLQYSSTPVNDRKTGIPENGNTSKRSLDWPKGILEMQRNWIGKGKGLSIDFPVQEIDQVATAWTKFWETVYGVTYLVIAPETAEKWIVRGWDASPEVRDYIVKSLKKSEQQRLEDAGDKSGVDTQLTVKNPANGEIVPLWVADYVLANVGTGMVMGVPAHDKRDFDFAKKYKLPIKQVVKYSDETIDRNVSEGRESHEGEGELINSGKFDGMSAWGVGKEKMAEWMIKEGFAKWETTYHLRDWVFSRQRYWGEPIPLVYCDKCGDENGVVPVPEDQLPLELPTLDSYEPTETGESPLSRVESWVNTTCPNCGEPAKRETDTMPNWAGSCWYFLAYPFWDAKLKGEIINNLIDAKKYIKDWSPVDWYLGGAEHAVLHLLYARFWVKVLQDIGILDFPEPFLRLRSVGLVLAEDGKKMSKSIGNVVNPDDMVEKYGSDAVRMYEMFMGPWDQSIAWDSGAISGQVRFLGRIKDTINMKGKVGEQTSPQLAAKLKELVDRVERGVLEQKFNTSIAGLMEFVNAWRDEGVVLSKDHLIMFASLLSIFAPLTADEISQVKDREWPDVSSISGVDRVQVTIAVQVNGKLRSTVSVESSIAENQEKVIELVMSNEVVQRWVEGEPKKIIFVPGKLVNLVV